MTRRCSLLAAELYSAFVTGECIIASSPRVAEMAKLTENSFRDINIAFANELSVICDRLGIDVWELIRLANRHPRVNVLQPGAGVGGHCIACDPWFIVSSAPEDAKLIRAAREVNDAKPHWVIAKAQEAISAILAKDTSRSASELTIACYGIAFKPDIDDLRDSPAMEIAQSLLASHPGKLLVVEPNIEELPKSLAKAQLVSMLDAAEADLHLLLVDHKYFRALKPNTSAPIIDTRGIWTAPRV
jgi:UDP-N-acetyl-D-mannosaminuronic acid dehydrogenase